MMDFHISEMIEEYAVQENTDLKLYSCKEVEKVIPQDLSVLKEIAEVKPIIIDFDLRKELENLRNLLK